MANDKKAARILELNVSFGNVNIGEDTVRIGITIPRKEISVSQADKHLCGKRLIGQIIAQAGKGGDGQGGLFEAGESLDGSFDVKSFNVKRKSLSCGLTFSIASVDINKLAYFAKRNGKLVVDEMTEIPEEDEGGDEEEGDEEEDE